MVSEFAQIAAKVLFTGLLFLLTLMLVREMWRLWFDDSLTLVQFEYFGGETVDREVGQHFTHTVRQELSRLAELYHGQRQASAGTGQRESGIAQASEGTDYRPLVLSPHSAVSSLPEVDQSLWSSVKTEVYGVPVARVISNFYNWVRQPAQINGRISKEGNGFRVYAELRNAPRSARGRIAGLKASHSWHFATSGEINGASVALACRIYRMLAASSSEVFAKIDDADFTRFNDAFAHYDRYVSSLQSGRPDSESLSSAGDIAQSLIDRNVDFPHLYKFAAYVFDEQGNVSEARRAAARYLAMLASENIQDDDITYVRQLAAAKPVAAQDAVALGLQGRIRPLQPGVSVGSAEAAAGTICCIVRDRSGVRYILSAEHILAGPAGTAVYQPGRHDGSSEADRIGEVARSVSLSRDQPNTAAGAIATLAEGVEAESAVAGIGELRGLATSITPGSSIKMVGRTSGLVEGKVKAVDVSLKIPTPVDGKYEPALFDGMILTTPISRGGDSGAPVVTEDNRLVGLVYAGSSEFTVIMPIEPTLRALEVELAQ